jgi:hypothetical protein
MKSFCEHCASAPATRVNWVNDTVVCGPCDERCVVTFRLFTVSLRKYNASSWFDRERPPARACGETTLTFFLLPHSTLPIWSAQCARRVLVHERVVHV